MNRTSLFLLALLALFAIAVLCAGCTRASPPLQEASLQEGARGTAGRELVDRTGRKVILSGPVKRLISTAPSNTEIIADLGMAELLVALDRHSAAVAGIPPGLVALDFFYPDAEVIAALEPDLILANGHNATGSGEDPFRVLRDMGIAVAYISMSKSIDDIYKDIAFTADVLGVPRRGEELVRSMEAEVEAVRNKTAAAQTKRSVYFELSAAPDMFTFGKDSYVDGMISAAGAVNIFANDPWLVSPGAEAVILRNPDVILTAVNYLDDPIAEIKKRPGFDRINAVINNRIYRIDTDSASRPSSRIVLALKQMAEAVYPELYE